MITKKPAIEEGTPQRKKFLLPFVPSINNKEIRGVLDVLKSGWLTTGVKTHNFQEEAKKYLGCKNALAVNSCTAALHLSLIAAGVKEGDEVITTPLTFISTVNTIIHQRATPVLVDIDKNTFNIDATKIEEKITKKTKAIIPVHYAGQPCDMSEILKIAKKYNLFVIEDAAHAFGSEYKGKKIGTISDFTNFSFYAAKNLTTAEGGMICIKNKKLYEKTKIISLHGMSKDAWKRYQKGGSWRYEVLYPGYKYNLPDILSVIGSAQLKKIDGFIKRKQQIAKMYEKAFSGMKEITLQNVKKDRTHSFYLYPVLINDEFLKINRDKFIEAMKAENIGLSVHFIPIYSHPFHKKTFNFKKEDFPVTEKIFNKIISLPIHSLMTDQDVNDVILATKKIINYYKK